MEKCKLGDIAKITMGQSPKGNTYNSLKNGMPFLQGNRTFGRLYPQIDTWTTNPIKIGKSKSVLMSVRAPVGALNVANQDICIGRGLCSIEMKNGDNKFLYYLLINYMKKIKNVSGGTVFDSINKRELEELEVNKFCNEDMNKIVYILSIIDEKIELNNKINNKLLEMGLLLVNKYFNEENDNISLENIIKFIKGKKPRNIINIKKENYGKYLTIACLNNQELNYADADKMIIANHDLLMVMDGASSGDIYYSDYGVVGSTLAKIDIIHEGFDKAYIYFCLKKYNELIKSKNTGSAIPHTDKVFVSSLEIAKIGIEKQQHFIKLLSKMQENKKENKKLEQLRDTLLPKLMNGEMDLF